MTHHHGWAIEGTVVTAPNGTKVDMWPFKAVAPSFDWGAFLQALATVLTPLPAANTIELQSAITQLQTSTTALQKLAKGMK